MVGAVSGRLAARHCWFVLGFALAAGGLGILAEAYLRLFPPRDLHPYLGEKSPLTGIFAPDADFAVGYRSWEAFRDDNAERMNAFLASHGQPGPLGVWAFFGNSFVQAPGMLADHVRAAAPQRCVFNLGRNELLPVRLAQIKLLLESGVRPERIFFVLMPVDVTVLGEQPLDTMQATSKGAIVYRPRLPAGRAGWLVEHSRLAFCAWVRAGRHRGNPQFNKRTLYQAIERPLLDDLDRLFGNLARLARQRQVPVTVVLIPAYHQITEQASFGFQDTLAGMLRRHGFDVLDPRRAFCEHPGRQDLFLPDKHFNLQGNQVLLAEVLAHVERQSIARGPAKAIVR